MIASNAIKRTAAISTLNLSQKTRVSRAASREGGGTVGMIDVDVTLGDRNHASVVLCHAKVFRASVARPGTPAPTMFILITPDEATPAMQNPEKDPEEWTTGEEPMTGPQRSYLQTLCREAGEDFDETLTKAVASRKIEELRAKTGRGKK